MRPGYELWRPNREKAGSVTTKFVVVLLLAATAVVAALVTIGGWSLLKGGSGMGIVCAIYAILYAFNQEWHVEEERPIGSGEDYGAGASSGAPQPA